MGFFSGIRRRIKKLIPKEVKPFLPYATALIPGSALGLGAFAKANPATYKALMAGGTRFLSDEDAAGAATVKVTLLNASSTAFVIDNLVSLSANENKQVISEPLIMEESEVLKVQAASGAVDVVASVLEINREDK